MAITRIKGSELAEAIRSWLKNSGQGEPQGEIATFVDDLEYARNIGVWAGVNFERILPFRAAVSQRFRIWSIIRNATIFLPIGVTWVALENAANSWAKSGDGNFLVHWQSLDGLLSLRNVAWFDAAIIGLLVLLTLILGWQEDGGKRRKDLEDEYFNLMVALERDLSGYRYLSLRDINNVASDTLQSLLEATNQLENSASTLSDASGKAYNLIESAGIVVKDFYEPAIQRLDSTLGGLASAIDAHQDMAAVVKDLQSQLASQASTVSQSISTASSSMESRITALVGTVETQLKQVGDLIDRQLQKAVSDVNNAAAANATSIGSQARQILDEIVGGLAQVATALSSIASDLERTNNAVMVNTRTLNDDLADIHEKLRDVIGTRR